MNKDNKKTSDNKEKSSGSVIGTILPLLIIGFSVFNLIKANIKSYKIDHPTIYDATYYINTKWKDVDGYVLEIYDNWCQLTRNGKVLSNECYFTTNSNGTGVGILEVCNSVGLDCDKNEITKVDYVQHFIE